MAECMILDGNNAVRYMFFDKTLESSQGMAIHGDHAFIMYHTGLCSVYDLKSRQSAPVATFKLASYNEGVPSKEYTNHANQAIFSKQHLGDNPIPLLYVMTGNGVGADSDGFYYRCAVENITRTDTEEGISFQSELVQTISYRNDSITDTQWETPCWGCPHFLPDDDNGALYMISARYRTTKEYLHLYDQNAFIITKFDLPAIESGAFITLTPKDIKDQFTTPFDILFTQGGTLYRNKIYFTFGFGDENYPCGLRVFDLSSKCMSAKMDITADGISSEEIESCAVYNGKLICNTNGGSLYILQDEILPFQ